MGMFDYLRCDYPLPIEGANGILYQTKDTPNQFMDTYTIGPDGQLYGEEYEIEDQSDPNAEGLRRLLGMMTKVNVRRVPVTDFIGEIRFYGGSSEPEFSAYFVAGRLKELNLIAERRGDLWK